MLTGYCSTDGYNWIQIGNSINVADMENDNQIGTHGPGTGKVCLLMEEFRQTLIFIFTVTPIH